MTGAACPPGSDAVVPRERVVINGGTVRLPGSIERDQNIVRQGIECAKGAAVLRSGDLVSPLHRALIATVGAARVHVIPCAAVRVIATGSELVSERAAVEGGQIRLSNGPMLRGLVESAGAVCVDEMHAPDNKDTIRSALVDAGSKNDVTIISGGASAGKYDLVHETLHEIGAEIRFHGVAQRPGKPMMFATLGDRLLFGLSGNPMACLVGFHAYALPALRKLMGMRFDSFRRDGELASDVEGHESFTWFMTARVAFERGCYRVRPIDGKGSADMFSSFQANALMRVPPKARLRAGDTISFQFLLGSNIC
jgi:molybdopterin molybdotransferase